MGKEVPCSRRWRVLILLTALVSTSLYLYAVAPPFRQVTHEANARRENRGRRGPPSALVTVSDDNVVCLRSAGHLPVLPRSAPPTQEYFLPGLKSPCWLQELRPQDIKIMQDGFSVTDKLHERAALYEPFASEEPRALRLRCLDFFYLIGAPKSGTTDLKFRIRMHPDVQKTNPAAYHWWTRRRYDEELLASSRLEGLAPVTFDEYLNMRESWLPGLTGTETCDDDCLPWTPFSRSISGECSPSLIFDEVPHRETLNKSDTSGIMPPLYETVPAGLAALQPRARLIVILREPGERLFSGYLYFEGGEKSGELFHNYTLKAIDVWNDCIKENSEEFCVTDPGKRQDFKGVRLYVSLYVLHLRRWLNAFPRSQLLALRTEDYGSDVNNTMLRVYQHLGLDTPPTQVMQDVVSLKRRNRRRKKVRQVMMLEKTRTLLNGFFEPYNTQLATLLRSHKFLWTDKRH